MSCLTRIEISIVERMAVSCPVSIVSITILIRRHWCIDSYRCKQSSSLGFITGIMLTHYIDVIMSTVASHITSLSIVYSTVYSGADQRKHQCVASLALEWGIHRSPVNSPHKWPVTWKMFPFDDVIMFHCKQSPSLKYILGIMHIVIALLCFFVVR